MILVKVEITYQLLVLVRNLVDSLHLTTVIFVIFRTVEQKENFLLMNVSFIIFLIVINYIILEIKVEEKSVNWLVMV